MSNIFNLGQWYYFGWIYDDILCINVWVVNVTNYTTQLCNLECALHICPKNASYVPHQMLDSYTNRAPTHEQMARLRFSSKSRGRVIIFILGTTSNLEVTWFILCKARFDYLKRIVCVFFKFLDGQRNFENKCKRFNF